MKVFTVSQINRIIKDLIDNEIILEDIVVTGELSSFSVTRNIAYFTLKDNDNLLSCVQFNCNQNFQIGDMVQCQGNIKYYPKGGKLTFQTLKLELCGQGELYQQFLQMKQKLELEGLFNEEHKVPLPRFINSIGVVTSATGAVLQDIKNVTSRRNPNLDIYVYDAQVQGKYAVNDVIQGITYFDNMTDVDVIIVARGGGSIEDLMPFNDEELARIAYICNKPIISAVGHETDFSILDFVADLRAPTPSAAAELVTYDKNDLIRYIKELFLSIQNKIENKVAEIEINYQILTSQLEKNINNIVNDEILYINRLVNSLDILIDNKLNNTLYKVDIATNTLDKLNPIKLLKSGYSVVSKENNVANVDNININDIIDIRLNNAKLTAKVLTKEMVNIDNKE